MYTGIVEGTGTISYLHNQTRGKCLGITPAFDFSDLNLGDSIAVNGTCLTITKMDNQVFYADVVQETLNKTNLATLNLHDEVNLERCARIGDRIGGHFVKGHVDGTGEIIDIAEDGIATWLTICFPAHLKPFLTPKGSIGLDGMSITVVDVQADTFTVTLIPHTRDVTIAKHYRVGTLVNLEADVLAKHIVALIGERI